mmetsp:Transcript_60698/g.157823  ORF Transcript_60698/g.157823 Transcript_60698/m.157823 type:complete len:277 (-) Transcript_60698:1369-2199(-)
MSLPATAHAPTAVEAASSSAARLVCTKSSAPGVQHSWSMEAESSTAQARVTAGTCRKVLRGWRVTTSGPRAPLRNNNARNHPLLSSHPSLSGAQQSRPRSISEVQRSLGNTCICGQNPAGRAKSTKEALALHFNTKCRTSSCLPLAIAVCTNVWPDSFLSSMHRPLASSNLSNNAKSDMLYCAATKSKGASRAMLTRLLNSNSRTTCRRPARNACDNKEPPKVPWSTSSVVPLNAKSLIKGLTAPGLLAPELDTQAATSARCTVAPFSTNKSTASA